MKKLTSLLVCCIIAAVSSITKVEAQTYVEYQSQALNVLYSAQIAEKYPQGTEGVDYSIQLKDRTEIINLKDAELEKEYSTQLIDLKTNTAVANSNRTFVFTDKTAPSVTLDEVITVIQDTDRVLGIHVKDNYDSTFTTVISGINTDVLGRYEAHIAVADSSGNKTESDVEILVAPAADVYSQARYINYTLAETDDTKSIKKIDDKEAPLLDVYAAVIEVAIGDDSTDLSDSAYAFDMYDSTQLQIQIEGEYDLNKAGEYALKYTVADHAGNESSADFTLYVRKAVSSRSTQSASISGSLPAVYSSGSSESTGNVLIDTAYAQLGSTAACTTVVANCLSAAGLDFWSSNYSLVSIDEMQIGDVLAFYSANGTYPYHVIMYIGDGQCINGNYNGVAQITSCSSARASYTEVRRYN